MSTKIKNEIKYTYLQDKPEKYVGQFMSLDQFSEFLDLVPLYRHDDAVKEKYIAIKFHLEFFRVKFKEVHDNVAQRFKQFGIGNVD